MTAAQLDTLVADARAAGKQADTVILVKDGDEVSVKSGVTPENLAKPNERVTVQQLHDIIAGNQAKGGAAAIGFATYSNTDRVTLTFVPKAALENSQSRS